MRSASKLAFCLIIAFLASHPFHDISVAQSPDSSQLKNQPTQTSSPDTNKPPSSQAHRVITNDDIPSRTVPNSTPLAEERRKRLNQCDRTCFAQVFKDSQSAFRQRYHYPFPYSTKDDQLFEDAIVNRMNYLRGNAEWQTLLRNALVAQELHCKSSNAYQQKLDLQRASGTPITSRDIAEEESTDKTTPPRSPNYNSATSAILQYKFQVEKKDPLLAVIVLNKYFEILKTSCSNLNGEE
jgi:hypothetical protein